MLYDSSLSMIKVMYTISRSNNRKRYSRNSRLKKGRANRFLDTQNCDTNIRLRMPKISKSRIQLKILKLPLFQTDTLKLAFNEQVFILFQYGTHFFYHETKILLFVDVPQNGHLRAKYFYVQFVCWVSSDSMWNDSFQIVHSLFCLVIVLLSIHLRQQESSNRPNCLMHVCMILFILHASIRFDVGRRRLKKH